MHVDFVCDGAQSDLVGGADHFAALNPPPAIHTLKPYGL